MRCSVPIQLRSPAAALVPCLPKPTHCFSSLKYLSIFPINACPLWPATRGTATSTPTEGILLLLLLEMTEVMEWREAGEGTLIPPPQSDGRQKDLKISVCLRLSTLYP